MKDGVEASTLTEETEAEILSYCERYPHPKSAILPSLWAVQHQLGYISPESIAEVANLLGLESTEVQAVSTFYSMYFEKPEGQHHIVVCMNVSCSLRGAEQIATHLQEKLSCESGQTTANGKLTWEKTVECLGACGGAPALQIDHEFQENLTTAAIDQLLEQIQNKKKTKHG